MNVAIGDIHGKNCWEKLLSDEADNIYFNGDYFDCYEKIPTVTQIRNFRKICDMARKDPRIHLCLGNHDFQYLRGLDRSEHYSGFQAYGRFDIQEALEGNIDLLKIVYQSEDYLISHAGISKTFLKSLCLENPLDINARFIEYRMSLAFCGYNRYGDDVTQGPLWIRPASLSKDKLDGYKQIVGHTKVLDIAISEDLVLVDCLDTIVKSYKF